MMDLVRAVLLLAVSGCGFEVTAARPDATQAPTDGAHDALGDTPTADAALDGPPALDIYIEAENFVLDTQPRTPSWVARTDVPAFSGVSFMFLSGGSGAVCPSNSTDTILACSAALYYDINVPAAGTYTLWLRMWADSTSVDSAYVTIDDPSAVSAQVVDDAEDSRWNWVKNPVAATYALAASTHRIGLWQREGGARVDRIALMASSDPPM